MSEARRWSWRWRCAGVWSSDTRTGAVGSAEVPTGAGSARPEYNWRNRSTRESGLAVGWGTRSVEVGGTIAASGRMVTGGTTEVAWSAAVAEGSTDPVAGAGTTTVTRA